MRLPDRALIFVNARCDALRSSAEAIRSARLDRKFVIVLHIQQASCQALPIAMGESRLCSRDYAQAGRPESASTSDVVVGMC
jgi:hypothetical protein